MNRNISNPILLQQKVSEGHLVVVNVMESRKIKLNAALTFWKKQDFAQLLTFLLRADDDSVFVDVLPFFTKRLNEDDKDQQKKIQLGFCLDLFPIIERLLNNKYEIYICTSLDFILALIKRWYFELRSMKNESRNQNLNSSLSLPGVYMRLISLEERIQHLSLKEENAGTKAKVVLEMMKQLQ